MSMGAPRFFGRDYARTLAAWTARFEAALPQIAEGCRAVTEYAAKFGIKSSIENHGFLVQDSDRCEKLMKTVNHPNFGWLIDIGNFLQIQLGSKLLSNKILVLPH